MRMTVVMAAAVLSLAATPVTAQSVAEFYAGKSITLIVGSTPGGGYDTQARLVARHIGRQYSAIRTVTVQNMPAAGSLAATNHMFNIAPKDGSTIALVQRGMLLIKNWNPGQVRFDLARFNWIGSVNREVALAVSRADAPVKISATTLHHRVDHRRDRGHRSGNHAAPPQCIDWHEICWSWAIPVSTRSCWRWSVTRCRRWPTGRSPAWKVARPTWFPEKKINLLMQIALQPDPEFAQVPSSRWTLCKTTPTAR